MDLGRVNILVQREFRPDLATGGRSDGTAQEIHPSRNGASPDGTQPVQGTLHGATGSGQVDGNDPSHPERPKCR